MPLSAISRSSRTFPETDFDPLLVRRQIKVRRLRYSRLIQIRLQLSNLTGEYLRSIVDLATKLRFQGAGMKHISVLAFCLIALLTLTACSPSETVKLGYLGGLSGRGADLGEAGRDGALLAVEQANAEGGVRGRKIVLLIEDDEQNPVVALKAAQTLVAAKVDALIGPMTSAIGDVVLPKINEVGLVSISPTITASTLAGKDDMLFKVAPSVEENTRRSAAFDFAQGTRRVAIAYDLNNRVFSEDWAKHYRAEFVSLGGAVVAEAGFTSGEDASYSRAIRQLVGSKPDCILLVSNAVDTVRLTQLARNIGFKSHVSTSTWAGTEYLLELGGRTVEGITLTQFFDREDQSTRYLAFSKAFRDRFNREPGYASVAAYDATRALFVAMSQRGAGSLKEALLTSGPYEGLQESWGFDRNGDARRKARIAVVRNARFVIVE
jgi:branched-chain amino acid transport system substrate-binding protein